MQLAYRTQLRRAFEQDEIHVHYQPKFHLRTGSLHGVEALLRWRTATGTSIPPANFVPMLEETGLIARVGTWLFARAAEDTGYWHSCGVDVVRVAINVSPLQLRCRNFRAWLLAMSGSWHQSGIGLDLELTESSLLPEADELAGLLESLVESRVRIALDDFGIGYSSLSLLAQLPVSYLKIDRSFIVAMMSSRKAAAVVRAIMRLGSEIGIETVAEGIETIDQLRWLQEQGCDIGQGHLFCQALGREELLAWLRTGAVLNQPACADTWRGKRLAEPA